jgi:hypothetical protein
METVFGTSHQNILPAMLFSLISVFYGPAVNGEEARREDKAADSPYVFEKIENVELNKKEIIAHSNAFIAEKFVSAKSVIQLNDAELGKIVGDVVLMNSKAGFFDGFKGIKTRLVLDAKDGKYRLQASNVEGIDGNGAVSFWGKLEGANRYRIEPLAQSVLSEFADDLLSYLRKAKSSANF